MYCGYGSIANSPTPPKGLTCTNLTAIATGCSANSGIICTQWESKDNNLCPGDYGGPLYVLDDPKKQPLTVGIATYSPEQRPNAPCLDGHKNEFSQIANFGEFIGFTINGPPGPPEEEYKKVGGKRNATFFEKTEKKKVPVEVSTVEVTETTVTETEIV